MRRVLLQRERTRRRRAEIGFGRTALVPTIIDTFSFIGLASLEFGQLPVVFDTAYKQKQGKK